MADSLPVGETERGVLAGVRAALQGVIQPVPFPPLTVSIVVLILM